MTPELQAVLNRSPVWQRLYDTDPRYRAAWDAGAGPGQSGPQPEVTEGPRYNHWAPLHWYAVEHAADWSVRRAKLFFNHWEKRIPEKGCGCKSNWLRLALKPDFGSAPAFFESCWSMHDVVTAELIEQGKRINRITLDECYAIWWPERLLLNAETSDKSQIAV